MIDLNRILAPYDRILLAVSICQAKKRGQHFGMIRNAFIRVVDFRNNNELMRYDLTENYSSMTAMISGEVYRYNNEWKFSAIGQGTNDNSIGEFTRRYVKV